MISHFAAYIHTKIIKSLSFFFKDEGKGSTRGYLFTFTILRSIMYDTVVGLSLIYVVMNLPFTVWLTRGFFLAIPKEIEEAAEIDGCSKLGIFLRITLPLSLYGLASTALLCFILTWNEFLLALILTGMNARTLPVQSLKFAEAMGLDWGALCAAATIILLPPMAMGIFLRKYIIRGLTFGAVKG